MPDPAAKISPLLLDEYFASADDRFLPALRNLHDPKRLAAIADRWKKDHRPWARSLIFKYLDEPFDDLGHEPIVKRLFKQAEQDKDDELMAAFAAAFDRMVRRIRRTRYRYDWQTRQSTQEETLYSPRNKLVKQQPARGERLFSYHTRYYLRRRAWRYFRRMAHQRPKDYCPAVADMLRRYIDADVANGENLLDNWSLMHACFGESEAISIDSSRINVRDGHTLAELKAAPDFPQLWQKPETASILLSLLTSAECRTVRAWAIQLLRAHHRDHFATISPDELLPLLDSDDDDVQQFAAEMLDAADLSRLDIATWLRLLKTRNATALELITAAMTKHVAPERLSLSQLVQIASAKPVSVARLGLRFLRERPIQSADDRAILSDLAELQCEGVAAAATAYALSILGTKANYNVVQVSRFFDSLLVEARDAAFAWLTPDSAGYNDPALWSRLTESPYDDVRFHVIAELEKRAKLPGAAEDQVQVVWTTVLLSIHRGSRAKLAALRQISREIRVNPSRAQSLIPVLAVAIRSVRAPEARAGIASIVRTVEVHAELLPALKNALPEMEITAEVTP